MPDNTENTKPDYALTHPVLTEEQARAWAYSNMQTKAIFALDGMYPTHDDEAITAAIVARRVSPAQVLAEMKAYFTVHKTSRGFVASRPWSKE